MITEDFRILESPTVSLVKPIADARERLLDRNDPDIANRVFSSDGGAAVNLWKRKATWTIPETETLARVIGGQAHDGMFSPNDSERKLPVILLSGVMEKAIRQNGGVVPPKHLIRSDRVSVKRWLHELNRLNRDSATTPKELKEVLRRAEEWSADMENSSVAPPPEEQPDYAYLWEQGFILAGNSPDQSATAPPPPLDVMETETRPGSPPFPDRRSTVPEASSPGPQNKAGSSVWYWVAGIGAAVLALIAVISRGKRRR